MLLVTLVKHKQSWTLVRVIRTDFSLQYIIVLRNASFWALCTVMPNTKTSEFGAEKGLSQGYARRQVAHVPKTPNSSKGIKKALLKVRWARGTVSCCKLLSVKSFFLAAIHIGQVRMFLQTSNNINVIFCSATFCLYMHGLLKVRALRIHILHISVYRQHSFTKGAEPAWLSKGNGAQGWK